MTAPLSRLGATFRKSLLRKNDELSIESLGNRLKKIGDIWVMKYVDDFDTLNVIYSARNAVGAKVVVDIDDNIWQMTPDNASFGTWKNHANRCLMVAESCRTADYVTVSTEFLKERMKDLSEKVFVLPNLIDPDNWTFKRKDHNKIRIGWVYSPTHVPDIPVINDALTKVYEKYGDTIEIVVFGTTIDFFDVPTTKIKGVAYADYPKMFTEAGIDISLAPLLDSDFNRAKSNIKWMESTMAGAAFVGSDLEPYQMVNSGETGFLCSTEKEWVKAISTLIEHKEMRHSFVERAKSKILKKYNIQTNTAWAEFYDLIC